MNQSQTRKWARAVLRDPFSTMVDVASAQQVLVNTTPIPLVTEQDLAWLSTLAKKKLIKGVKNRRRFRKIISNLR